MRKIRIKSRAVAVVAAALLPLLAAAGVINYTATYDDSKLTLGTDTLGGVTYTTVHYDGLYNGWEPGAPFLPIDYLCFSVPYNATDYTVTATVSGTVTHNTSYLVYPCQQNGWYNGGTVPITTPDNTIYYSNLGYPTQRAWVVKNGFMAGENRVVTVAVMPIAFLHTGNNNSVSLSTNVNISLNYELNKSQSVAPLVRNDSNLRNEGHEITKGIVVNPDDVVANAPLSGSNIINSSMVHPDDSITEPYSYLIITTPDYVHVMRKLAALKRQKGYTVKVATWEDAIAQPYACMGDSIPLMLDDQSYIGETDDQGKLRQYIRYHYLHHGTEYVLLAGAEVPHRDFGGCTDMYYSDLAGEWYDEAGTYPTVYVGRLLGNTEGQFDNYNDKLFRYELNPGNGNTSYLRRELAFESPNSETELSSINFLLPDVTQIGLSELEYYVSGNEFIGMINNNHYGFIATFADGNTTYFTLNEENDPTPAHYIWAHNNVRDPLVTDNETGNALDCLTNKQYPMIFFSGNGKTIAYHDNQQYTIDKSLGASFTMGKNYGGPVYMGLTKDLVYFYDMTYFFPSFASSLNYESPIGKSYALAKQLWDIPAIQSEKVKVYTCHNYLGDPTVVLWNDTPQNYSNIILTRGDSSITVSGISEPSTILALYSNDGKTLSQKTSASNFTFSHVSPNGTVMLYKRNCIPYIAPMVIQNTTLNKSQYVIATDVTAGKSVDNNRTSGQVTVTGDIEYEIEHTGEVRLCGGFRVDKGVKFSVKPSTYNK